MLEFNGVTGVILAGGRSSRMGTNKALLPYRGKPLIEHAKNLLKEIGISSIYISGTIEGYEAISDKTPFNGPASAMMQIIQRFSSSKGIIFIPVDMPLLNSEILTSLFSLRRTACFKEYFLPAVIYSPFNKESSAYSVYQLLQDMEVTEIDLPERFVPYMVNVNTKEDWESIKA